MTYINMNTLFASLDARRAEAEDFISLFSTEQLAEASRIASLYHVTGSLKHKEAIAATLKGSNHA